MLLVVIDSLRADAIFGDTVATPNIDALAARGAAFKQCVSTCTTTTPSFSSILTGCYPPRHGVRGLRGYRLSPAPKTMAEAFRDAGYATSAEVTGPLLPETGILRGFDGPSHRHAKHARFFDWGKRAIDRISSLAEPWFLLLHTWEVHRPYRAPPDFAPRRDKAAYEAAVATSDDELGPVVEAAGDRSVVVVTGDHGEQYARSRLEDVFGGIARRGRRKLKLASWLAPLDRKLAALEIGHGFALREHLVRVPLIVAGPGIPSAEVDDQVRHVDLFPTLAQVCDLEMPADVDGRSLIRRIHGDALPVEPAYMEAVGVKLEGKRIVGARIPEWKLVKPGGGRPALYKLDGGAPPDERRNLYNRYPDVVRELEGFVERVAASEITGDSGMTADQETVVEQHLRDLGYL